MAEANQITITYDDSKFFEALANPEGVMPYLGEAMNGIMTEFVAIAEVPAPESEANSPGRVDAEGKPMGYYERGRGWWYPVLTHNTLGLQSEIPTIGKHGKAPHTMGAGRLLARGIAGVAGYKLIPNSQQMEENWGAEVEINTDKVIGHLWNTATYSDLVQGWAQTALHRSRQWITVLTNWQANGMQAVVNEKTFEAIDKYFNQK